MMQSKLNIAQHSDSVHGSLSHAYPTYFLDYCEQDLIVTDTLTDTDFIENVSILAGIRFGRVTRKCVFGGSK